MSCDVGEVTERLENEQICYKLSLLMDGSPGDVSEEPLTYGKRKKGWRMSCDIGGATEGMENEL